MEELGARLPVENLKTFYRAAESLLASSQHRRIGIRLGECARRVIAADDLTEGNNGVPSEPLTQSIALFALGENEQIADPKVSYSLEAEVHRYEGSLIRQALEASGGSVTRAARLLGVTHQGLAFILNGRHSDLLSSRTPVKRRRRSIIRFH